ncbi:MAG: ATP synthase F1 subunit gamma, partial [Bacillota bacterium]
MDNPSEIRRRIKTVRGIEHITRAMKMVSAARARRATQMILAALPYAIRMRRLMRTIVLHAPQAQHELLQHHELGRDLYLVFTGERGMCGSCNTAVIKEWEHHIQSTHAQSDVIVIGRWGIDHLRNRGIKPTLAYPAISKEALFDEMRIIAARVTDLYLDKNYHSVYMVYSRFINTLSRKVIVFKLLPFEPGDEAEGEPLGEWDFEPSPQSMFDYLLPKYVSTQMAAAYLDSRASEFSARMMAMDTATRNAEELIGKLFLQYNRARQAEITQEIAELVG